MTISKATAELLWQHLRDSFTEEYYTSREQAEAYANAANELASLIGKPTDFAAYPSRSHTEAKPVFVVCR